MTNTNTLVITFSGNVANTNITITALNLDNNTEEAEEVSNLDVINQNEQSQKEYENDEEKQFIIDIYFLNVEKLDVERYKNEDYYSTKYYLWN